MPGRQLHGQNTVTAKPFYCAFIAACACLVLPQSASAHGVEEVKPATVYMHMTRDGYQPVNVSFVAGSTVVFENTDTVELWPASNIHPSHTIFPEFDPQQPVPPGEQWSFTFNRPGTWRYHDHLYPQITGSITVSVSGQTEEEEIVEIKKFTSELTYNESIAQDSQAISDDDNALFSHLKKYGPLSTVEQLESLEPIIGDCHDRAHDAGRFAYELDGPAAFKQCGVKCHSGCYHGAIEGFFHLEGTVDLKESLQTLCRSQQNPFEIYQCLHGIGHGLMAWSDYDLPAALGSCDLLDEHQDFCYSGVLMENLVGAIDGIPGHQSRYISGDPFYPCNVLDDKYRPACYAGQTSYMRILFDEDVGKIADACHQVAPPYNADCFASLGRDLASLHRDNPAAIIDGCQHARAGNVRQRCLLGAASELFWEPAEKEDIVGLCNQLTESSEKRACYHLLYNRAAQVFPNWTEARQVCRDISMPGRLGCYYFTRILTDYYRFYPYISVFNFSHD